MLPYSFRLCLVVFLAFTLILSLAVFCSAPHVIVPWHLQIKRNKNDFLLPCSVLSGRRPGTEPEWKNCLILHVWLNLERFQRRGLYLQPHPVEPRPETVHPLLCKYLPQTLTNSGNDPTFGSFMFSIEPTMISLIFLIFYWHFWYFIDIFDILLIFSIFYW